MNSSAIKRPCGLLKIVTALVYTKMALITPNAQATRGWRRRTAVRHTATAAEVIMASTPVAYAAACASTFARNAAVTTNAISR